ncbi:MAG: ATP-grasp domain-containing protein, partial [Gammaproteobacteria bacterium]
DFPENVDVVFIEQDYFSKFKHLCEIVDAVLPIAPESDDILKTLSEIVISQKKILLGSEPEVIKQTTSKKSTTDLFADQKLTVINTRFVKENNDYPENEHGWIVKPDQSVGSDRIIICHNHQEVLEAASKCDAAIIQPYIKGKAASISMLSNKGQSVIIGYNEQIIEQQSNRLIFTGSKVNGLLEYEDEFDQLAGSIAKVLPTLRGYVGIDLIIEKDQIYIVEVNPRLTTSYVALSESIGFNPAKMILDIFCKNKLPQLEYSKFKMINIKL